MYKVQKFQTQIVSEGNTSKYLAHTNKTINRVFPYIPSHSLHKQHSWWTCLKGNKHLLSVLLENFFQTKIRKLDWGVETLKLKRGKWILNKIDFFVILDRAWRAIWTTTWAWAGPLWTTPTSPAPPPPATTTRTRTTATLGSCTRSTVGRRWCTRRRRRRRRAAAGRWRTTGARATTRHSCGVSRRTTTRRSIHSYVSAFARFHACILYVHRAHMHFIKLEERGLYVCL